MIGPDAATGCSRLAGSAAAGAANCEPELSVIIASFNAEGTIGVCLASLARQRTARPFEVIVVDSSTDDTPALVAAGYPAVRLYRFAQRKYCGDARNHGVAVARGRVIAFVDADCTVDEGWVDALLVAHADPHLAVGGVIDNGSPHGRVQWAHYFCEFSRWMPGAAAGEIDEVAGCCLSLKREALDRYGPFVEGTYCSDTALLWKIAGAGQWVLVCPAVHVYHTSIGDLAGFLRHEVVHGRSFARVRLQEQGLSRRRRALFAAALPLLPWVLFLRIASRVFGRRKYSRPFVAASPIVWLGLAAWSWGEFVGYIDPSGAS